MVEFDVFLSCSPDDTVVADAWRDALEARGVRCWFAPLDNPSGAFSSICRGRAVARCKALILVWSVLTNESRTAECETSLARKMSKPVIVIRVDETRPSDRFRGLLGGAPVVNACGVAARSRVSLVVDALNNPGAAAAWVDERNVKIEPGPSAVVFKALRTVLAIRTHRANPTLSPAVRFRMAGHATLIPEKEHVIAIGMHDDDNWQRLFDAVELAQESGHLRNRETTLMRGKRLPRVQVELDLPGIEIDFPSREILWNGRAATTRFSVRAGSHLEARDYAGEFVFRVAGFPIARLPFRVGVGSGNSLKCDPPHYGAGDDVAGRCAMPFAGDGDYPAAAAADRPAIFTAETRAYRSAFVSFAREDDVSVLTRVLELRRAMPQFEIFLSSEATRDGGNWKERLEQEIVARDAFYLVWSRAASRSREVAYEWQSAYWLRGIESIAPVALHGAGFEPPPALLEKLVFEEPLASASESAPSVDAGQHPWTFSRSGTYRDHWKAVAYDVSALINELFPKRLRDAMRRAIRLSLKIFS